MSTATAVSALQGVPVNQELLAAVSTSVQSALGMCGLKTRCTGVSCVPGSEPGIVTGLIGLYGKSTGFASVNVSERFAIKAVGSLLGEQYDRLTSQVVDGVGEITNIIVGGIKSTLARSDWGFSQITIPTVIVGQNFTIAYSRGLEYLMVTFEHEDPEALRLEDRMMSVSLSLLKL